MGFGVAAQLALAFSVELAEAGLAADSKSDRAQASRGSVFVTGTLCLRMAVANPLSGPPCKAIPS